MANDTVNTEAARPADEEADHIWVISNRKDDRTVLFERDHAHPGGEAFIGGPTPARVGKTAAIDRLLHSGEIVEIPEPPDGPKKPIDHSKGAPPPPPAQPGQAIQLGRVMDPDLVPERAARRVQAKQSALPDKIPSRAVVPPPPSSEKDTNQS